MSVIRIERAAVLTMVEGQAPIPGGVVQWDGREITYAGCAASAPDVRVDRVIDGSGCVVMPGLINAHTHLAMTLFRGFADDMPLKPWLEERIWPAEKRLVADDVYWGTRLGVLELLRGGCTCLNDMYHFDRTAAQAAEDGLIRACPSGVMLGFLDDPFGMLENAVEFVVAIREQGHSRLHPMLGPHAPYTCPRPLLERVLQEAIAHDLPLHIHVAETSREYDDSRREHGMSPVQYLDSLGFLQAKTALAHCVWLDDRDIEILAERQAGVIHCPSSNMKLGSGFARVPDLLAAGAVVGLGTDGAASNNNLDMFEEMHLAALIHKGRTGDPTVVPARRALEMATRDAAKALGIDNLVGTLEPGKRADLALVSFAAPHLTPVHGICSHLVYSAGASDVRMTVVDGAVVMEEGQFPGQDAEEVYRNADVRARVLCSS